MSACAEFQDDQDAGVAGFSDAERQRIRDFKIPGEEDWSKRDPRYYARKPTINVGEWHRDYAEKLYQLERAAGNRV